MNTMAYSNLILAMSVPEHWCKVPGREEGNYTLDRWKQFTLPRTLDSSGYDVFSSCEMFNETRINNETESITTLCQYGYEYDTSWAKTTVPSTQDWVCEKELYNSNVLAAAKLGEVLAGCVFGYLADAIGRRPVFLLSLVITCIGRFISPFVVNIYWMFMAASVLATIPSTSAAQSCLVIVMELTHPEDRAFIAQMQNFGWMTGVCLLPIIYWLTQDWVIYMLVSTVPLLFYFPLCYWLVESPRWLLSRGRVPECLQQLIKIAKVNGTRLSPDAALLLQNTAQKPEKVYGIGSLFSNWKLARKSILLITCWICSIMSYNTIVLNVSSLNGNPLLNFFLQSLAEMPSYIVGKIFSDRFGRRFTGGLGFIIAICSLTPIILTVHDSSLKWLEVPLVIVTKFAISLCFFVSSLQALEIYPTCVRQGGFTLGITCGSIVSILAPYVVFLGVTYDARIVHVIIAGLCLLGLIMQIFLPETLHEKLPETLQEAARFGEDQGYWSFPQKKDDLYIVANLKCVERQMSDTEY